MSVISKRISILILIIVYILFCINFVVSNKNKIQDTPKQDIITTPIESSKPVETVKPMPPITNIYFVNVPILNIRINPSIDSEKIGEYVQDQRIDVIDKNEIWFQTREGYVHSSYLTPLNEYIEKISQPISRGSIPLNYIHSSTFNITTKSNLTEKDIHILVTGTDLEGIERSIVDVENKYRINGFFILAVARLESGNGSSDIAHDKNNLFGLNAVDDDPYASAFRYKTKSDSVYAFGKIIRERYINKGNTTISKINHIYCTNPEWSDMLLEIIKEDHDRIKR